MFLALLRLAVIALLAVMIAELMLSLNRTGLPTVVVVVDDSASMGIADRYEGKVREKIARSIEAGRSG